MNTIKEHRLALNLTQPDVSAALREVDRRMDVGMVSRFEQGVCLPTENVLRALETVLQADRRELYGEVELAGIGAETPRQRPLTARLAQAIPYGRDHAVTRADLADRFSMDDRSIRRAIAEAREDGLIICNDGDGRGYYQSDDVGVIRKQYRQERARMRSIYMASKRMREVLDAAGERV